MPVARLTGRAALLHVNLEQLDVVATGLTGVNCLHRHDAVVHRGVSFSYGVVNELGEDKELAAVVAADGVGHGGLLRINGVAPRGPNTASI